MTKLHKQSKFWRLLAWLLLSSLSLSYVNNIATAANVPSSAALTDLDLANLQIADLSKLNGVPVLPLYSVDDAIALPDVHVGAAPNPDHLQVALQVGHWQSEQMPDEQAGLRSAGGASWGSYSELSANLDISRRVAALLKADNISVAILPATVPINYSADVFLAIHADWASLADKHGVKFARSRYSTIPDVDDALLQTMYKYYQQATGMPKQNGITNNMTQYYAFNNWKYHYSLNRATPAGIIEMGFLTNATDRNILFNQPDEVAKGIADGLEAFLNDPKRTQAKPATTIPVLTVQGPSGRVVSVYAENKTNDLLAYVMSGQKFGYYEQVPNGYTIWLPVINQFGFIKAEDVAIETGN